MIVEQKGNNALAAAPAPAEQRFTTKLQSALSANGGASDEAALDALDVFREDVAPRTSGGP